ncbi:MAG: glycoside hydrolase family 3 N-terminal domain-containing protein [Nitrososphaerota archaeon]|nr:glycoside hydrolase family 3 N-terminal domain-containing protein [Nitrososphaerota archaeon]
MTLEEKVAQLSSIDVSKLLDGRRFSVDKARELIGHGIGQITRVSGSRIGLTPREAAEVANAIQKFLREETRLGIPAIVHEECLAGFMAVNATSFPQAINLASTWNPQLVEGVAGVIRIQMRAVGAHQGLAPVLDIARDPRWGRTEETYGEDPYLVACMGVAYIRGLQNSDLRYGVIATPKHFVAHGIPEGGRNCAPVHVSPRELREIFMFPFEAAVKEAGALSLMNAYHDIDGVPCAASRELLTNVLRGEWGFQGYVVSDYGAIRMLKTFHLIALDEMDAAIQALEAGIDVELPDRLCYGEPLLQAVREGFISEELIDTAVSRILRAKILLGLFEDPYVDVEKAPSLFDTEEDRMLALQAARESIILLKNDGILPIPSSVKSIAVVGPNAASTRCLLGDYSYTVHTRMATDAVRIVSVLEGLRNRAPSSCDIGYAIGCDISGESKDGFDEAVTLAEKSDIVVAVLGEVSGLFGSGLSGEGNDRVSLKLPGVQEEFVEALHHTGKPLVLVLVNGRPLILDRIVDKCQAVIKAWFPGEEGGNAIADVIFGYYNPAGRLPISIPRETGQIPVYYSRRPSSFRGYVSMDAKPLYPFGYGLSYTNFDYRDLEVSPSRIQPNGYVEVKFKVGNIGTRSGDEVVQLYVHKEVSSVARPIKELKGFKRIPIEVSETKTVRFKLWAEQLAFYDRRMKLTVEPGVYTVMVGSSSEDIRLTGKFEIIGSSRILESRRIFFSHVDVY